MSKKLLEDIGFLNGLSYKAAQGLACALRKEKWDKKPTKEFLKSLRRDAIKMNPTLFERLGFAEHWRQILKSHRTKSLTGKSASIKKELRAEAKLIEKAIADKASKKEIRRAIQFCLMTNAYVPKHRL